MRPLAVFFFVLTGLTATAQAWDTLRIMTYNLTMYGQQFGSCTSTNNDIAAKDGYLKTITKYVSPDVLVVNEMGPYASLADRIVQLVLNTDGETKYNKCPIQKNTSSLINGVFYNSDKLALASQNMVSVDTLGNNLGRIIDVDKFYFLDAALNDTSDTVFFYVCAAHLKAGSTASDETERALAAAALMRHISQESGAGYYFLCGDMNLKGSNEAAFQEFIANQYGDARFNDPINQIGNWYNNSTYKSIHTQSTRTDYTNGGCFSSGGLDDRFDLILMSNQIIQDTGTVSYILDSYHTYGQDGNHFNQALKDGSNTSEPSDVINALFEMSDHLPVSADFKVKTLPADTSSNIGLRSENASKSCKIWVQEGQLRIQSQLPKGELNVYDVNGKLLLNRQLKSGYNAISIDDLEGILVIQIQGKNFISHQKLVILH